MKKPTLFYALLLSALVGYSQSEKRVMSVVDFLNIPGVSSLQLSPDGKEVLYVFSESDWEENRQIGHVWRVGADGSDARQITSGKGESSPLWSPDGKWISFIAKRNDDKVNQIYLMRKDGGEGMLLTSHKTPVGSARWSGDSKFIYFIANDTLTKEEEKAKKLKDDVYALDENYKQRHLWKVSVDTKEESRITEGEFSVMSYDVSKDGQKILVHRGVNPLFDFYKESEIWMLDANGGNGQQLTDNGVGEGGARLSPDGNTVLFTAGANQEFDSYYNDNLFLISLNQNPKAVIKTSDWPYDIFSAEWSADGNSIFIRANMGAEMQLWQYQVSNSKLTQLTEGKHSIAQWDYEPLANKHIMTRSTIENPGDIFAYEKGKLRQITRHYDYLNQDYHMPRQEVISWKGEDGATVEGLIYYPHNYQAGNKYPLVVQTHGGPASSDRYGLSRGFTRYNPVLTGKGYVVLQPNYRGSTGYGDDFMRDMVGSYFNQSHLDVMTGVDYLIDQGIVDPDRMVKMGWSAGGHMTNKIITFTDRFKAASSGAGAVNWIGMYAQSDIRTYRTPWFGGSPWQKDAPIDVYWNNSPLKDISNVTTPTLVIVGESDPRVPLPQSVELYRALRSLDVPTHLYVAPREPHGWRELRHRLYKINVELDWFAKYALDQEYEWEKVKAD